MNLPSQPSRRDTLAAALGLLAAQYALAGGDPPATQPTEPIIDIHQHTNYSGRTDEQLIFHQRRMGVIRTILLPAGTPVSRPSTFDGKTNGLDAGCGGNETVLRIASQLPAEFSFFANEVSDLPTAREEIGKYLKLGGLGIGEQKFNVPGDSPAIETIAQIASDFNVPLLMHFEDSRFNTGYANFHKTLARFPKVNFIAHAQTFWAHIDRDYSDAKNLYPKGKVTSGGLSDRYLSEYPNLFADMSAGSGLNALLRDEDHARGFLDRHQDKIMYGSDCNDAVGRGPTCQGWMTIQTVRRLTAGTGIGRKILVENAKRMFKFASPREI